LAPEDPNATVGLAPKAGTGAVPAFDPVEALLKRFHFYTGWPLNSAEKVLKERTKRQMEFPALRSTIY
jgi:hypothetical protein